MLILLSLLAADPAMVTDVRVATVTPEPAMPRRSRYRLDPNIAGPADGKGDAVGVTGQPCAVVGGRLCTRKPRTIYAASY